MAMSKWIERSMSIFRSTLVLSSRLGLSNFIMTTALNLFSIVLQHFVCTSVAEAGRIFDKRSPNQYLQSSVDAYFYLQSESQQND